MFEKLSYIEIGDNKLPIKCDLRVLSAIQDEYESMIAFEQKLIGMKPKKDSNGSYIYKSDGTVDYSVGEPSISVVAFAIPLFIRSGIEQAEEQGEDYSEIEWKDDLKDANFNYIEVALAIHQEFQRCFHRKKKKMNTKNQTKKQTTKA